MREQLWLTHSKTSPWPSVKSWFTVILLFLPAVLDLYLPYLRKCILVSKQWQKNPLCTVQYSTSQYSTVRKNAHRPNCEYKVHRNRSWIRFLLLLHGCLLCHTHACLSIFHCNSIPHDRQHITISPLLYSIRTAKKLEWENKVKWYFTEEKFNKINYF